MNPSTLLYFGAGHDTRPLAMKDYKTFTRFVFIDALPALPHYTPTQAGFEANKDEESFLAKLVVEAKKKRFLETERAPDKITFTRKRRGQPNQHLEYFYNMTVERALQDIPEVVAQALWVHVAGFHPFAYGLRMEHIPNCLQNLAMVRLACQPRTCARLEKQDVQAHVQGTLCVPLLPPSGRRPGTGERGSSGSPRLCAEIITSSLSRLCFDVEDVVTSFLSNGSQYVLSLTCRRFRALGGGKKFREAYYDTPGTDMWIHLYQCGFRTKYSCVTSALVCGRDGLLDYIAGPNPEGITPFPDPYYQAYVADHGYDVHDEYRRLKKQLEPNQAWLQDQCEEEQHDMREELFRCGKTIRDILTAPARDVIDDDNGALARALAAIGDEEPTPQRVPGETLHAYKTRLSAIGEYTDPQRCLTCNEYCYDTFCETHLINELKSLVGPKRGMKIFQAFDTDIFYRLRTPTDIFNVPGIGPKSGRIVLQSLLGINIP